MFFFPQLKQWHTFLLRKEVGWLLLFSKMYANIKQMMEVKDKGVNKLITLPCGMSDLSELPALIQEQSELFNTTVLKKTEKGLFMANKTQLRCLSKLRKHPYGLCFTLLLTDMPHKCLSFTIWPLHQSSG